MIYFSSLNVFTSNEKIAKLVLYENVNLGYYTRRILMKKSLCAALSILMFLTTMAACSPKPPETATTTTTTTSGPATTTTSAQATDAPKKSVTISVTTNMVGGADVEFQKVCASFTAETGIGVDYAGNTNDYESLMKTRMATNDLPDVWSTHGWAVARYSPFLRPLNGQPWVSNISPLIKPMITGSDGNVYVLPVDMDIAGIVYNRDILKECGINVDDIKTWVDFEKACDSVKAKGYIPVYLGGKDSWTIGQFFDWVAPSFYITNDASNDREALLNGTFDWNKWKDIAAMFKKWNDSGYFNVDSTTSDYNTATQQLGQGKVAFEFFGNYAAADASKAGPANIGMMPVPAYSSSDTPTLIAGEHLALGVWKDTTHEAEVLQFMNYLARPDIVKELATSTGMPSGLTGIQVDTGNVAQDYDKYSSIRTFPYFDRVYLPSGMWDDLCNTGIGILNGSMTLDDVVNTMKTSYTEKMNH